MVKPKGKGEGATDTEAADGADRDQSALQRMQDRILEAIATTKDALQQDIAQVATGLGLLKAEHDKLKDRVKSMEITVQELAPDHAAVKVQMANALDRLKVLERRAEDAENRSRRNNVRLVGLPEKIEGDDMVGYLDNWLRTEVAPEGLSPFFSLERAHRVPARPPAPGLPPRPVVFKLLHYRDRDWLLQRAREAGPFQVDNNRVTMFPDYTFETQRLRANFLSLKRELRGEGIKYSLLFPAKLRVVVDEKSLFFTTSADAWAWWDTYKAGTDGAKARAEEAREAQPIRKSQRIRKNRRRTGKPSVSQTESERKAALQAVVDLSSATRSQSGKGTDSDEQGTGSETGLSEFGGAKGPIVTPQTSGEIVEA